MKNQGDGYLIAQLLIEVDISKMQVKLKDHMPGEEKNAIQRIENRLSYMPKTTGTISSVMIARDNEEGRDYEVLYSIGICFGGEVKREAKPYRRTKSVNTYKGNN